MIEGPRSFGSISLGQTSKEGWKSFSDFGLCNVARPQEVCDILASLDRLLVCHELQPGTRLLTSGGMFALLLCVDPSKILLS